MQTVLIDTAFLMARRSTCARANVGAIIAREGRILSSGYNGAPAGMPHCTHAWPFDKDEGCGVSVHAEANAIAFAARHGTALLGASMYTTLAPCRKCAELIINAGIAEVVFAQYFRTAEGLVLLEEAGVATTHAYADQVVTG